tara:strand:- start:187 stop:642 length:456 start_codon:yes stop_codon:yes gene_type:complete
MTDIQTNHVSLIKSYADKNEIIIQRFIDQHFRHLLCEEISKLKSLGKTRGVITIYCDEMKEVVQTIKNNYWTNMCPNKLILLCMLNISKTEKIFFKVYPDEDYKVLVNLKGIENENEIRKSHYERIAKIKKNQSQSICSNLCHKIWQMFTF